MCGIAGFIDTQLSADAKRDLTHRMLCQITHRGPEASNVFIDGPVSLGHNRLKIIDLSDAANQPFEYEDVIIIFNGEIYNFQALRSELAPYQVRVVALLPSILVFFAAQRHFIEGASSSGIKG